VYLIFIYIEIEKKIYMQVKSVYLGTEGSHKLILKFLKWSI